MLHFVAVVVVGVLIVFSRTGFGAELPAAPVAEPAIAIVASIAG
jgi:hypothetical protein